MKEKKIENYLHLYLGCKCMWRVLGYYEWKQSSIDLKILDRIYDHQPFEIKPILRPLSDMASVEAEDFALLCLNSPHAPKDFVTIEKDEVQVELVHNDDGLMLDDDVELYLNTSCRCFDGYIAIMKDGRIGISEEDDAPSSEMKPVDDVYGKVHWLLSKHFDLFSLIEAGLAIDKTKTPTANV